METWFIIGCGRSGTTLLASLLSKYKGVVALPEAQFFTEALIKEKQYGYKKARDYYVNHWRFKKNWKSADKAKKIEASSVSQLHKQVCTLENKSEVTINIDHTPINSNYVWFLKDNVPDSKFIHIIRDGRAVFASGKKTDWGEVHPLKAATWWMSQLSNIKEGDDSVLVKYEDLVLDSGFVIESITRKFSFSTAFKEGKDSFVMPKYTQRQHSLIGKLPDSKRIDSWKRELPSWEVSVYESLASNVLLNYGYELENKDGSIRPQGVYKHIINIRFLIMIPFRKARSVIRRLL